MRERSHQQAGRDDQHQRQRDLGSPAARSAGAMPRAPCPARWPPSFSDENELPARGGPRRREPEQDAGHQRNRDREQQHRRVDAHFRQPRNVGRAEGLAKATPLQATATPAKTAHRREQQALGDQLTDQAGASGAEGCPHRELARPRDRSREQQVRDVRTGDEQHHRDGAEAAAAAGAGSRPPADASSVRTRELNQPFPCGNSRSIRRAKTIELGLRAHRRDSRRRACR